MTKRRHGPVTMFRFGHAVVQGVIGLFTAGSVIFAAHSLFLRYYAREWSGIQFAGVNGCAGEDRIANGDLFEGQTFCNHAINFVPWVELYRRHWQAALIFYSGVLLLLMIIGFIMLRVQSRLGASQPYGATAAASPLDSEHLR